MSWHNSLVDGERSCPGCDGLTVFDEDSQENICLGCGLAVLDCECNGTRTYHWPSGEIKKT